MNLLCHANSAMKHTDKAQRLVKNFRIYLMAAWTILLLGFIVFGLHVSRKKIEEEARIQLSTLFEQNLVYRRWVASHGGVYVPVTDTFKPNPYLLSPHRDLTATNGMKLTLVNPAWMTRQVFELLNKQQALPIINRLTSRKYINPANKPDAWEEQALLSFERGQTEMSDIKELNAQPYMRLMKPIVTETGCLICHGHQDYTVGDIRGGISVSIPMKPYYDALSGEKSQIIASYLAFWAIGMVFIVFFTGKVSRQQNTIIESKNDLERKNAELSLIFQVSSAISRTLDMDTLLNNILNTLTGLDILNVEHKAGIFIVEGEQMKLVAHLGHTELFLDSHKEMKVGDCLCGLAARTGEIIISSDSERDDRHTFRYPDMTPHGHIILPLKAKEKIVGVLYLYMPAAAQANEDKMKMLITAGEQIGMALDHARLFEETKALSLHDSLTGLSNRHFFNQIIEREMATIKRKDETISFIMIDLDHFKEINDTFGHHTGDRILIEAANLIRNTVRKADLVFRFGGDEFLVLLTNTDCDKTTNMVARLLEAVGIWNKDKAGAFGCRLSFSLGCAVCEKECDVQTALKEADARMYRNKREKKHERDS